MNDIDEENKDWVEFLEDFTSAEVYTLRIKNFKEFINNNNNNNATVTENLNNYFNKHHAEKKFAPTCYRSWFSIFAKFWLITGNGDLKMILPQLYAKFDTWESGYNEKHARAFSKEEMLKFHKEHKNDNIGILYKAYPIFLS